MDRVPSRYHHEGRSHTRQRRRDRKREPEDPCWCLFIFPRTRALPRRPIRRGRYPHRHARYKFHHVPRRSPALRLRRSTPRGSTVGSVHRDVARDFTFPAVAVVKQACLVEVEFFAGLGGELEVRTFDDRVDRAGFLAETAIDALHHVDVVTHRSAVPSLRRGPASMVIAWAGQIASQSLQAMQRSSPFG